MKLLEGKAVAVTGGGGGLGLCYAVAMAEAGALLVISDMVLDAAQDAVRAVAQVGGMAVAMKADVTQAADVDALLDRTKEEFGSLDVVLHLAGTLPRLPLVDTPEEVWDRTMATNLRSTYLLTRAAIRRMLPRKRGTIVHAASAAGLRGLENGAAYAASKAAIIALTRSVALELRDSGVRVNCFGPGATDTAIWRAGRADPDIERLRSQRQVYDPHDFSNVLVFLASDLSAPLNGEFISREPPK